MASQTLETVIAINAQIGNGFGAVGATLTELGALVGGLSRELIEFGKDSAEVFKDYEKSMREAEVALSTSHGRNTKELASAMDQLNAKATEWAATTIFHTDDVASAINQAAHAGWDLDQILNGIPVAMELAQAGSMDLSDALTYITKTMKAFDVPYDELGEFIDMWVYAANSSTGDVQDFGDAMKKMGATMRFTDSKEELFALIGLMHDMGETGSTAATLLRTSMMRILAPSGVASKVMEQLGATDDEINEIREDASKMAALDLLESYGFSAFQDNGQAKPIIDIYANLGEVLAQIAGGYENITKNQTTLGVLGTIFGNRGITGALDVVTALQNAVELRDKLLAGNAEGYGEYAAQTMMDSLYGRTEIFYSKVERLKQVVGGELNDQISSVMDNVGHIVDNIAELDDGKLSALVSGLEVIAVAGPGLLMAGTAFRIIGHMLGPVGGIGLGIIALTAAATAIEKLRESDLKSTFGDMEMDVNGITSYIHTLGDDFRNAYVYTDQFQDALQKATANYREASGTFSTNLFSMMISNAKLTDNDLLNLLNMGEKIHEYAEEAIYTAASGDAEYWTQLFGGEEAALENPIYQSIIEKTNAAYEESKSELKTIGENMRKTITDAYTNDNKIDEEEYNKILEYFRQYNSMVAKAAAQAQDEESRIQMRKWLLQGQTGSFDDINSLSKQAAAERNEIIQKENDLYLDKMARLIENNGTEEEKRSAEAYHQERLDEISTNWDNFMLTLWDSQLSNNGQMENWQLLGDAAESLINGTASTKEALAEVDKLGRSTYSGNGATILDNGSDRAQLALITGYMLTALGGKDELQRKIDLYTTQGNTEMAQRLTKFLAMEQLANNFFDVTRTDPLQVFGLNIDLFGKYETNSAVGEWGRRGNVENFESSYVNGRDIYLAQKEVERLQAEIRQAEGLLDGTVQRPWSWYLFNGAEDQRVKLYGNYSFGEYVGGGLYDQLIDAQLKLETLMAESAKREKEQAEKVNGTYIDESVFPAAPIALHTVDTSDGAEDKLLQLEQQGVTVDIKTDEHELAATIDAYDGQTLTEYLNGNADNLHMTIWSEDGQLLTENVTGDTKQLAAEIAKYNGMVVRVKISGQKLFAEGGRATTASIFGEAGPEWAIPEAHSERTAELLNAARAASGFSWGELLDRFGGLNANPQHQPTSIVYSPTINAADATGVEKVLQDDKRRFEEWFENKKMHDAVEVYT